MSVNAWKLLNKSEAMKQQEFHGVQTKVHVVHNPARKALLVFVQNFGQVQKPFKISEVIIISGDYICLFKASMQHMQQGANCFIGWAFVQC